MTRKKHNSFFLENFRCYESDLRRLRSVMGQILDLNDTATVRNGLRGDVTQQTVQPNSENPTSVSFSRNSISTQHVQNSNGTSDKLPKADPLQSSSFGQAKLTETFKESQPGLYSNRSSLLSSLQGEVRELLKVFTSSITSSSTHTKNSHLLFSTSKTPNIFQSPESGKVGTTFQEAKLAAPLALLESNAFLLKTESGLPLSQSVVTSLNTSLNLDSSRNAPLHLALKSVLGSLQSFFPSERLNVQYNNASLGNIYPSSLGQEEGLHFIQWAAKLGVSPQNLAILLPFVAHFNEAVPHEQPVLQGLFALLGILTGSSQMSLASLTWPYLKGMMIFENYAKLNSFHSPLLDELGALLSTSRRRLRKEAKKRISNLDKVSRKDAYLAEADPQEKEEDMESLIDLWPKKESNNSSSSFYYM